MTDTKDTAPRTEQKSAATDSLLNFYDWAMGLCNMKEGTNCTHDDVIEAIKASNYENEDTLLRTLRRYRKRPAKG